MKQKSDVLVELYIPSHSTEIEVIEIEVEGAHDDLYVSDVTAYDKVTNTCIIDGEMLDEICTELNEKHQDILYNHYIDREAVRADALYDQMKEEGL